MDQCQTRRPKGENTTLQTPKLKTCPFCGGDASLEKKDGMFTIGCLDESCLGFPTVTFQTRKDAIDGWNRRA